MGVFWWLGGNIPSYQSMPKLQRHQRSVLALYCLYVGQVIIFCLCSHMITGMKKFTPSNMDSEESLYYQKRAPIVQRPLAVPSDLAEEIQEFHSFPFGWFILSQFFIYVMQPKDHLLELISRRRRELANLRPLVGYVNISCAPL